MAISREQTQEKLDKHALAAGTHKPEQVYTVADRFEEHALNSDDKTFIIYQGKNYSFADINKQANRIAGVILSQGLCLGDTVALMMDNRPEFFSCYLALAKLGVTAALINTNTSEIALAHALIETQAKLVILGSECLSNALTVQNELDKLITLVLPDDEQKQACEHHYDDLSVLMCEHSDANLPKDCRVGLLAQDKLFYVFTSGTTGLPKAANMSHMRWLNTGEFNASVLDVKKSDTFYCFLPLYHGAAGMSLASAALAKGARILLRRRFSTRKFWQEVREYDVTICQYIGEICRYLLSQPEQENDGDNPLTRIIGAGLNPTVWQAFQNRFAIGQVVEGWGATEANTGIINVDNKLGSVGRIPDFTKSNARLVRYDMDTDQHILDDKGRYILCQPGEVGEIIGMILNIPGMAAGRFEGYSNDQATESKILRNVLTEGDAWYSSGDLLRMDEDGYFYFVDRIGDTFRWKSENVSTMEVTDSLSSYPGIESINIYGVQVPGQEGRAGMATLVLSEGCQFEPSDFYKYCAMHLPKYAVPVFIRLAQQAEITATFKLRKVDLQKQGYSPELCNDPLYVCDEKQGNYLELTQQSLAAQGFEPFQPAQANN